METQTHTYGYARALTRDQDLSAQLDDLRSFGIDDGHIHVDAFTRTGPSRTQYKRLLRHLRKGDVLAVPTISALGETAREIMEAWGHVTKECKADLAVLDTPLLDTRTTPYNMTGRVVEDVVLQLLAAVTQAEHDSRQRLQAEGIARAQAKGVHTGRSAMKRPANYATVKDDYEAHRITRQEAADRLGVSRTTFDKWRRQDAEQPSTQEQQR